MSDTVLNDEQLAVSKMLEASDRLEESETFNADAVLDDVSDTVSSEKQEQYEKIEQQAIAQMSGYGLLMVQQLVRWKTKNPNIAIRPELQEQFATVLPDALAEWGIKAPDFLDKYAATMALGMTVIQITTDMGAQHMQYKQSLIGCDDGEETAA
ncbi:hypothetical protein [Photobacterium damselae]|uniref:hypothetical protein n=1 Tax=Photobacterium damselae TaxID=38293 RepID=UPI000D04C0DC|nr:hypothetical protein [Photobacterium damselae]NVO73222.1 hypothetical protein [Photobacterium damselae subsp. damselae]PSB81806.1 hypothetical protein C5F61_01245 [Photobacterium damselae subsp. damselae]PSB83002.1 hypothetical protein C5F62_08640 [Photobacterium damselae subsp. damselae]TGZ34028.1 hypothetical protein EQ875_02594 [Photobacterium damselae subsp. damselae]UKA28971.1 hypothetical protein IPQ37_13250 [Photobacterium damselae subsp. damselae]